MSIDKLETIKDILKDNYQDRMSEEIINNYADDLFDSLFVSENSLDDVFAIISQYEEEANIESGGDWYYIFVQMIDLLENGEKTARRLYDSFMNDADIIDTFSKLAEENAEYISEEELSKAKEKAFAVFDRGFLALYGITEDDG